jgi:uncharacterized protein YjbI with pentapeptide repeats
VINLIRGVPIIDNFPSQRTNNICNEEILEESNESEEANFEEPKGFNSSNHDFYRFFEENYSISPEESKRAWSILIIIFILGSFVSCIGNGFVESRREDMKEDLIFAHRRGNNEVVKQMIIKISNENPSTSNMEKIDFAKINLSGANIGDTNLVNFNFSDAYLIGTNLSNTNLRNASLKNANLRNADLRNANLENTNLDGTNLTGANIENAILTGYNNLKPEQVTSARGWEMAKYNEDMRKELGLK